MEKQHGGNAGNAAVAAARLSSSLSCSRSDTGVGLCTLVAGDANGDDILSSLADEGVRTAGLVRVDKTPGAVSPFTYIIVDEEKGTRTCIHTPGLCADLLSEDGDGRGVDVRAIARSRVVFFDGRHTAAAVEIARRCVSQEPRPLIVLEAESVRPGLESLMMYADGILTSSNFPSDMTGVEHLGEALRDMLRRFPVKWIVTTMGSSGSVMVERLSTPSAAEDVRTIDEVIEVLRSVLVTPRASSDERAPKALFDIDHSGLGGYTVAGDWVAAGPVVSSPAFRLAEDGGDSSDTAYVCRFASASVLPPALVRDSTGAGDAYNGAIVSALAQGDIPWSVSMILASIVAAINCTNVGAREGLPRLDQMSATLRKLLIGRELG